MTTQYVSDVALERHPTAKSAAKVLKVKLAGSDNSELVFTADLYGYESADQVQWVQGFKLSVAAKKLLDEVVESLIERVGKDGALDWQIPDLQKHIEDFELLWKKKVFSAALKAYGLLDRLTLEQATLVLQEHYVVEPIMES